MDLTCRRLDPSPGLVAFADDVGSNGPVVAVGGKTQWEVGGTSDPLARPVRAPDTLIDHSPDDLAVRCDAGVTVAELHAVLAEHDQMVPLDPADPRCATVGGVLAVGRSGLRRLRYGPVRDLLLEVWFANAAGRLVRSGAPVVKNVSGYDLRRLLVGSLGTLGLIGQVVLRAVPRPHTSTWFTSRCDPFDLWRGLYEPSSILWDGTTTFVLLEGASVDVKRQSVSMGLVELPGPPRLPRGGRRSLPPSELSSLSGRFMAEVGVGIVHTSEPSATHRYLDPLHARVKRTFDPTGRLNPGRFPT